MKTTKKDFALFRRECGRWIKFFGLKHWRIEFYHEKRDKARAFCETSYWEKCADISLADEWKHGEITTDQLKRCAFHEVAELLMAGAVATMQTYISQQEAMRISHEVLYCLENSVYEKLK